MQKKLDELSAFGQAIVSLFIGDRFAATLIKDSHIYSGDFLHRRRGTLFKKPYRTKVETQHAGGIPTVNC